MTEQSSGVASCNKRTLKQSTKEKETEHQSEMIIDLDVTRELPVKKPLSAYVHFLNEGREKMQITHPHIGVIE